jgi:hypothetical protein
MKSTRFRRAAVVLIDTLLLGLCLAHLSYVVGRPDSPIVVTPDGGKVIVEKTRSPDKSEDLAPGDLLLGRTIDRERSNYMVSCPPREVLFSRSRCSSRGRRFDHRAEPWLSSFGRPGSCGRILAYRNPGRWPGLRRAQSFPAPPAAPFPGERRALAMFTIRW